MGMFCPKCGGKIGVAQPFCKFCGATVPVRMPQAPSPVPLPEVPQQVLTAAESRQTQDIIRLPVTVPYLACKVCNRGELIHKNEYRMNETIVVIGYILCIPGWLGIVVAILIFFAAIVTAKPLIVGLGTVAAIWIFISSLISTLLGRLLTMKKWVLECTVCCQEINASKPPGEHGVLLRPLPDRWERWMWIAVAALIVVLGAIAIW